MAISLNGTLVSTGATAADFTTLNSGANISNDDDDLDGGGAVGDKMSNTTELLASDTLLGGASGVYDFSSGGADEGKHFIGWINTKTPINVTTGIQTYFGNAAGHNGVWNNMPTGFYRGGFATRVINPALDFTSATTWTVGGNIAQLDDVTEMGFQFTTISSIMGSFNNLQIAKFTVGFGMRADAGTLGTPNTIEDIRAEDEDTNYYGWVTGVGSTFNLKGGIYIGPATGDVASWFVDGPFTVSFQDEQVAAGFYGLFLRGANTTVEFTLANIGAAVPANSRWSFTVESTMGNTTGGFIDNSGLWAGSDVITLNANCDLLGTTLLDGTSLVMNGATLTGISVQAANTADDVAYIVCDDLALISDSDFTFSDGHAIEINTAGTYTFSGNSFTGYLGTPGTNLTPSSGSTDAAIHNTSGGLVTINVAGGGDTPSIRNTAVSTTQVNNNVAVTLTGMRDTTEVRILDNATKEFIDGIETVTAGTTNNRSFTFSLGAGVTVDIAVFNTEWILPPNNRIEDYVIPTSDTSLPISQIRDRNYLNP
jgi:hypothetical protein